MEQFITRILEIDKQARKMTLDSDALKKEADKEIAEKAKEIRDKYKTKTDKAVEEYEESNTKKSNAKLAEKKQQYAEILEEFGKSYEANCDEWVKQLVSRTLA